MANERMYHIVVINERTGKKVYTTADPVTHAQGCTIMSKMSVTSQCRVQLEEATLLWEQYGLDSSSFVLRDDGKVLAYVHRTPHGWIFTVEGVCDGMFKGRCGAQTAAMAIVKA